MQDDELVKASLNGTPQAYRALVERHLGEVRAFLFERVGSLAAADSAAQEAFTRAWLGLGSLRKPESFGAWVKGIALRVTREASRRAPAEGPAVAAGPTPGPDEALVRAVAKLPDSCRPTLEMRYYAGLTCEQIARREGVPVGTITKRLSRAYALLRETLSEESP